MKYLLFLFLFSSGCLVYKLSGTQLPTHIKSIAIPFIEDRTRGGVPQMSETLQQQMVDKFVRQNSLRLLSDENSADAYVEAHIADYSNQPEAVSQTQATQNRVSISVQIRIVDRNKEADLVNRMFTQAVLYNPSQGLNGELEAARLALRQIAEEAFTACSADW
jgi:Lipopolysaccharide-assembly